MGRRDELPILRTREPRRGEVLQRLRRASGGAGDRPRAALLHAAPPRREDPRLQERARGRAQAGHRPLRRRRALDGARRARRSRGVASPPRSPLPDPRGRRPPLRGDHQPVHRRRHHGALRRPDRPRGPRPARLRGRARAGARPRGARRRRAARERARFRGADGPQLGRGRRRANRRRPAHGLHRAGSRRRARRPRAAAGAAGRRQRDRADRTARVGFLRPPRPRGAEPQGRERPCAGVRPAGPGSDPEPLRPFTRPRLLALRRPGARARAAREGSARRAVRSADGRPAHRGAGRGKEPAVSRVRRALPRRAAPLCPRALPRTHAPLPRHRRAGARSLRRPPRRLGGGHPRRRGARSRRARSPPTRSRWPSGSSFSARPIPRWLLRSWSPRRAARVFSSHSAI